MKITKLEKLWLGLTLLFFILYNIPGIPGYSDVRGLIVHALLTIVPLWVCVYVGLVLVMRQYRLKK